ncbi:hypothetical protein H9P43_007857 [Blastocladiella emersonii ATCC 22665]|nr:hypothetical protein H9P43_007857 [Blastocladiella emersonii ATCC 22665]
MTNLNYDTVAVAPAPDDHGHGHGRGLTDAGPTTADPPSSNRRISHSETVALQIVYRTLTQELTQPASVAGGAHGSGSSLTDLAATHGDVHKLSPHALELRFATSLATGLDDGAVARRLAKFGPNVIAPPPARWAAMAANYLFGGFAGIMWVAAAITFIAWEPLGGDNPSASTLALAVTILLVIFLQAGFTAFQDFKSSRIMASIDAMLPSSATVIRNGGAHATVPVADLVPGDLVVLRYGQKVPADLRLVRVSGLRIDNSMLTGEADPVHATTDATDPVLLESRNIALMGTLVCEGEGVGVVVASGNRAVMAQVARLAGASDAAAAGDASPSAAAAAAAKPPPTAAPMTTLQREINAFVKIIAMISLTTASVCLAWYFAFLHVRFPRFLDTPTALSTVAGILVAYVPEGLPIATTLALSIVARRLLGHRVLVKNLAVVETLGCCSVLCSDKTGTLTTNVMSVNSVAVGVADAAVPVAEITATSPAAIALTTAAIVCNGSRFDGPASDPVATRRIVGDPTDAALFRFGHMHTPADVAAGADALLRLAHVPFNSKTKRMVTVVGAGGAASESAAATLRVLAGAPAEQVLLVKGAPDYLLPLARRYISADDGTERPLTAAAAAQLARTQAALSARGERVILLARQVPPAPFPTDDDTVDRDAWLNTTLADHGLTVLGLVGLVDPPRPEIPGVVRALRGADVRVFMVTGDFPATAAAIARATGIVTRDVVHSAEELRERVRRMAREPCAAAAGGGKQKKKGDRSTTILTMAAAAAAGAAGEGDEVPYALTPLPASASDSERAGRVYRDAALVLSGADLTGMTAAQWAAACDYDELVFARTTPEQKLRIVQALQARGETVAVTGDGVNDAPALKNADLGIAMGSGADVAMAAADMVFLDSNFSAMVMALRLGRAVFENLKKVCLYLLPAGSFSELTPVLANLFLGVPLPLSGFLMIIVCVVTDLFPSLALVLEDAEADLLARAPRRPGRDAMVNSRLLLHAYAFVGVVQSVLAHGMYFLYMYREWGLAPGALFLAFDRFTPETTNLAQADLDAAVRGAQCAYFVALVILQFGNLLATRTRRASIVTQPPTRNPALFAAMAASAGVAAIVVYAPPVQDLIGTYPIPALYWLVPAALAPVIPVLDEVRKAVVRRWPASRVARIAW